MSAAASRPPECILKAAGIDWLTLTSVSRETKERMNREFNREVARDLREGFAVIPGGLYGFVGKRTRHALLAQKEDRALLRLSGDGAGRASLLAARGDNCTRLDLQCTVCLPDGTVSAWLSRAERSCSKRRLLRGKCPVVDGKRRNLKTYQVSIGSRQSEVYVRLYDKFLESGEERFKNCVRLEIEYKGKAAQRRWEALADGTISLMGLLQLLLQDLHERGVDTSIVDLERQDIVLPKAQPSKENRTWGWWASQVAPSVARSVAERGWYTAFSILFDGALTQFDRTAIMNSLSVAWGN
jgi:hypothetical protein